MVRQVSYDVEGFCERNRDVLFTDLIQLMQSSTQFVFVCVFLSVGLFVCLSLSVYCSVCLIICQKVVHGSWMKFCWVLGVSFIAKSVGQQGVNQSINQSIQKNVYSASYVVLNG